MRQSLGLIEVVGLSSAVEVADTMVKAANVELTELEVTKGGGFVVIKVTGDVGAVKAAVDAGTACALKYSCLRSRHVIARPLEGTHKVFTEPNPNKKRPMFYGVAPQEPEKKNDVDKKPEAEPAIKAEEASTEEPAQQESVVSAEVTAEASEAPEVTPEEGKETADAAPKAKSTKKTVKKREKK